MLIADSLLAWAYRSTTAVGFDESPNAVDIRFETIVIRDGSISGTMGENAIVVVERNSNV